jgi:hypothetical protein
MVMLDVFRSILIYVSTGLTVEYVKFWTHSPKLKQDRIGANPVPTLLACKSVDDGWQVSEDVEATTTEIAVLFVSSAHCSDHEDSTNRVKMQTHQQDAQPAKQ